MNSGKPFLGSPGHVTLGQGPELLLPVNDYWWFKEFLEILQRVGIDFTDVAFCEG